jgi:hypothetical protein
MIKRGSNLSHKTVSIAKWLDCQKIKIEKFLWHDRCRLKVFDYAEHDGMFWVKNYRSYYKIGEGHPREKYFENFFLEMTRIEGNPNLTFSKRKP